MDQREIEILIVTIEEIIRAGLEDQDLADRYRVILRRLRAASADERDFREI